MGDEKESGAPRHGLIDERGVRRARTRPQRIVVLIVLAALVLVAGTAWLALRPRVDDFTVTTWTSAVVEKRRLTETLQVSGTIDVEREEDVGALQPGILAAVRASIGQRVRAGDVLARIGSKSLQDQLAQAESTLDKTRRDMEKLALENRYTMEAAARARPALERAVTEAARDVENTRQLAAANAATTRDREAAQDREAAARDALARADADRDHAAAVYELTRKNSEADIALMTAGIRRLEEDLSDCTVRAPFDGTVMDSYAQPGAFISQYEKLFHLADTAHPRAVLDVPEDVVASLKTGQAVSVLSGSAQFPGVIERIGLEAQVSTSGSTATVPVYVTPTGGPGTLIPGSSVSADIILGVKDGALVLPRAAYLSTGSEHTAYRIQGDRAFRVEVAFGIIQEDEVEVLSGLAEGDRVITSGYQDFIDRASVHLRPGGDTSAPGGAGGKAQ